MAVIVYYLRTDTSLACHEADVEVLTLSSRQENGRKGQKCCREADVGVLTLSSRQAGGGM